MKTFLISSILLGGLFAHAIANQDSVLNCLIQKIEVTQFDLIHFDAGTQQEVRWLELQCDEDTFGKDEHKAFANAPIGLLPILQQKKQQNIKSEFKITLGGYAGTLLALDGKSVGPVQPNLLNDSHFVYSMDEIFTDGSRLTEIYKKNCLQNCGQNGAQFNAKDASLFRLSIDTFRKRTQTGDGRGTDGDLFASVTAEGSVEMNQNPGDSIQFSARDSVGITGFLLMSRFPSTLPMDTASLVCTRPDNCILIQQ